MERQGLVRAWSWAHNAIVTITYPNGIILEAIVLSHEENEIRAIAAGCDDVLAFTRIHGTWISEEIEPVAIEFAWQWLPVLFASCAIISVAPNPTSSANSSMAPILSQRKMPSAN